MRFIELDAKAFKAEMELNKDSYLLDIREEYEYEDSNIGGQNIPMGQVLSNLKGFEDKSDIYVICKSGKRSSAIAYHLSNKLNDCNIYFCKGGIEAYCEI
tara:strand:+ start:86859 stop:87158 length:300 start_codon:yes stop_codon:yes gene_type:complete